MALAVRAVDGTVSGSRGLLLGVVTGAATYALALVLTRAVTRKDVDQAFALIRRKPYVESAASPDA